MRRTFRGLGDGPHRGQGQQRHPHADGKEHELETESIKETETISQIESETTSQYTFDENETNASSINTGDRNHGKLWLVIAIIALAGCIAAAVMYVVSKRK